MSALHNPAAEAKLSSNLEAKLERGLVQDESALLNKRTGANPLDRNHDGRVDARDLAPNAGMNSGLNSGAHHNPLDKNFDGRVDARDFAPNAGLNSGAHHNPLDRNHDGRVDARDFVPGMTSTQYSTTQYTSGLNTGNRSSIGLVRSEPTVLETVQKETVIHERIHPVQKEEIQPIIYREREQLDVKQVTQMMHETQIQPTIVQQRQLPAERRVDVVERSGPIAENIHLATREVDATMRSQVVHAPIVNEVIRKTIIEEIQPVLERDIIQSTVIQNTQPIYEKIVEAPQVYRETIITTQNRGIVGGGSLEALQAQGFNLGSYTSTTTGYGSNMTTGAHHNPLDRNHDGRVDARDFAPNAGMNSGVHHNPMDKNFDGRVDARDFAPNAGMNSGAHHNPLDRNHDGRVDARDLAPNAGMNSGLTGETLSTHHGMVNSNSSNYVTGNRRKSLVEALPASYSYLNQGTNQGLTTDAKIAEAQMLNQQTNPSLASKAVL